MPFLQEFWNNDCKEDNFNIIWYSVILTATLYFQYSSDLLIYWTSFLWMLSFLFLHAPKQAQVQLTPQEKGRTIKTKNWKFRCLAEKWPPTALALVTLNQYNCKIFGSGALHGKMLVVTLPGSRIIENTGFLFLALCGEL